MLKYVLKRIGYMVIVFVLMSLIMFFLYNSVPGDPARAEVEQYRDTVTAEEYEKRYQAARERLGLNDPLITRYGKWFGNLIQGDFGESSKYRIPVSELVVEPMKNTIFLNVFSIILTLAITIPLGIICAVKRKSWFDSFVQVITIVGYSIPVFIIGLVMIYIFAVQLRWFPVSGMSTPNFTGTGWEVFLDKMWYMGLPLIVLIIGALGGMTRYVRASMIDALRMDYVRTARAKGLKEKVVIYSHAWRNALLPVITLIIGWFLSVFSGSLIVETMFGLNGLGKLYYDGLMTQDYNVALAMQLFYMVIALIGNLIIDLSYGIVDPRVRVNN